MKGPVRIFIFSALLVLLADGAWATDHNANCRQSGQQKTSECNAEGSAAEAANTSQAGAIGGSMPGKQIKIGANGQQQSALDSANRLNNAKNLCEAKKQECESKCDQEKSQAEADAEANRNKMTGACDGMCAVYKQQAAQIPETKNSSCTMPIAGKIGELANGANAAQQAANQAGQTGGQSGGMPPMPPPSSNDKDKQPEPTPTPTPNTVDKMACSTDPGAIADANCTDALVSKCTPGLAANSQSDSTCDAFTARYCATSGASPQPTPFPTANTAGANTNRPGMGVGTQYCNTAVAKNFCSEPGRSQCATCQNYRNTFSDTCKQNPASCAPTPFSASCPDAEPPIATGTPLGTSPVGGDLMGGGSTGGGGDDRFSDLQAQTVREGQARGATEAGPNLNLGVSEGGGSGASSGGQYGESSYKPTHYSIAGIKPSKPGSPGARIPASAEIAAQEGSTIFNISSRAIQAMCNANRLNHCGRN